MKHLKSVMYSKSLVHTVLVLMHFYFQAYVLTVRSVTLKDKDTEYGGKSR